MTNPEIPQDSTPPLETVTTAYNEVLGHNKRHTGFGASFGNLLKAYTEAQDAEPNTPSAEDIHTAVNEKVNDATAEGDMEGELQGVLHEDTFMRIGIKLAPLGSQITDTTGERAGSTELLPTVENTQLFTDFLEQQDPEKFQHDASNLALTTDVVTTLQKTVAACYGKLPEDMSEEQRQAVQQYGEDTLRTFLEIDDTYKRMGLDNPDLYQHYIAEGKTGYTDDQRKLHRTATKYLATYKILEDYVTYWGRGVLPERLATGSMESLATDKLPYFDGGHEDLATEVSDIIALTQTERTQQFGVEAAQAMLAGIEETSRELEQEPDEWYASDRNRRLLDNFTAELRAAINTGAGNNR